MKQLKTFSAIVLLLAFLLSTTGVQVFKHFCGGHLAETSLYTKSNPCMDDAGKELCKPNPKGKCCDDEAEFHQLDVDFLVQNQQSIEVNQFDFQLIAFNLFQNTYEFDYAGPSFFLDRAPPNQHSIPLYKLFKRYTFYG